MLQSIVVFFSVRESADAYFYYLAFNIQPLFRACSQWGGAFLSKEVPSLPRWLGVCKIHWAGVGADYQSPVLMARPKASVLASSAWGRALESFLQQQITDARKESPEVKSSVSEQ